MNSGSYRGSKLNESSRGRYRNFRGRDSEEKYIPDHSRHLEKDEDCPPGLDKENEEEEEQENEKFKPLFKNSPLAFDTYSHEALKFRSGMRGDDGVVYNTAEKLRDHDLFLVKPIMLRSNIPITKYAQYVCQIYASCAHREEMEAPIIRHQTKTEVVVIKEFLDFIPSFNQIDVLNAISYIGHIFNYLPKFKDAVDLNLCLGPIQYHHQSIAYLSRDIYENHPNVSRFSLFCSKSNLRLICLKATIVLLSHAIMDFKQRTGTISQNEDFLLIDGAVKYSRIMMKCTPENEFCEENYNKDTRYILELATAYNILFPVENYDHLPEYFLPSSLPYYTQLHAFGEYNPFSHLGGDNEFYRHLSTTPKIEDPNIENGKLCVFYLPIISDVKYETDKWVEIGIQRMEASTSLLQIMNALTVCTCYEKVFRNKMAEDVRFINFQSVDEVHQYINQIAIPADFDVHGKKYFDGNNFTLYIPLLFQGKIINVHICDY
jgi:hypothetical protein